MIRGKTESGFEFEISKNSLNDWRLLKALATIDKDPLKLVDVLDKLLGEKQVEKLEKHIEKEDGTVPIEKMSEEIADIFKSGNVELKNS